MNQAIAEQLPPSRLQVAATDVAVLTRIFEADVNLAVWQRKHSAAVNTYADWMLAQSDAFVWQEVIATAQVRQQALLKLAEHPNKMAFVEDFVEVLEMFACLFELDHIGLRLRVLEKPMCPKFHTDRVPCRLITTFGGTGTEWHGETTKHAPSTGVQRLDSGAVALLKGDAWHGNEGLGLVHRSPALQAGQKRLLLTLDFG